LRMRKVKSTAARSFESMPMSIIIIPRTIQCAMFGARSCLKIGRFAGHMICAHGGERSRCCRIWRRDQTSGDAVRSRPDARSNGLGVTERARAQSGWVVRIDKIRRHSGSPISGMTSVFFECGSGLDLSGRGAARG
jgi:hypothetical protein